MKKISFKNTIIAGTVGIAFLLPNIAVAQLADIPFIGDPAPDGGVPGPGIPGPDRNPCVLNPALCRTSTPSTPTPTPSGPSAGRVLGAGIIGGFIGGAIANRMARQRQPQVIYQQAPQPVVYNNAHYQYCRVKYNSWNPNTNLYLSYSGVYKPCISPGM